jgi:hypothetical protein
MKFLKGFMRSMVSMACYAVIGYAAVGFIYVGFGDLLLWLSGPVSAGTKEELLWMVPILVTAGIAVWILKRIKTREQSELARLTGKVVQESWGTEPFIVSFLVMALLVFGLAMAL